MPDPINAGDAAAAQGTFAPRRALVDEVYERLIELLLDAEFDPGARLPIDALARAWHVSPTPIREALARAEASGLVEREALKGYRVAPLLPLAEFEHLMEVRMLIEPYCAAKACERADDRTIDYLEEQHFAMRDAPKGPTSHDYRDYLRADVAFHETIAAASGNRFLQVSLAATGPLAHRFRRFSGTVRDAPDAIVEHFEVLQAIRARDSAAAMTAMQRHLQGVAERGRADP